MSKQAFNSKGFMFLSPYYGKSKTTEILNRGLELDKINAARKKKLTEAKAPKPNNWQPSKNTHKVHAKFSNAFNNVVAQNYDWAVSQGQKLNKNHEDYDPQAYATWMKMKNEETQLAQFFNDQIAEVENFQEQFSETDEAGNPLYDRSSLAYAPLDVTLSDWEQQKRMFEGTEWESDYFKDQQLLRDENGIPIPMNDGTNRLQTVNGTPVKAYDGFGEVVQDVRNEKLIYNMRWEAVNNMNPNDWTTNPSNGEIFYKGGDYHNNPDFDFGETLYKKNFMGNPTTAFLKDMPKWEEGDVHAKSGRIKTSFLKDFSNQVYASLNYRKETIGGETQQNFKNTFAPKMYNHYANEYFNEQGNQNPSAATIMNMTTNANEARLEPNQKWTAFIQAMGWDEDGSGYGDYTFQNYVLYKTMDEYLDQLGSKNPIDNANEAEMFTRFFNFPTNKLGNTSYSVYGYGAKGEDSDYTDAPTREYGYNNIYNHGKKISTQFNIQPNKNKKPNVYIEGFPTPYARDGQSLIADIGGLNITLEGTWQNIQGMVLREVEAGTGNMQMVTAGSDFDNDDEYVPMIKMLVKSDQISRIMEKYQEKAGGEDGMSDDDAELYDVLKRLQGSGKHATIWVPFYDVYDRKATDIGSDFYNSKGGRHVRRFNEYLDGLSDNTGTGSVNLEDEL